MFEALSAHLLPGTPLVPHPQTRVHTRTLPLRSLVFTDPEQTWASFYDELTHPLNRKRTFGGYILVMGGAFFCYGCQIVRNYPYGLPVVNVFQVGRDFLVIAGLQVCVGCYHAAWYVLDVCLPLRALSYPPKDRLSPLPSHRTPHPLGLRSSRPSTWATPSPSWVRAHAIFLILSATAAL